MRSCCCIVVLRAARARVRGTISGRSRGSAHAMPPTAWLGTRAERLSREVSLVGRNRPKCGRFRRAFQGYGACLAGLGQTTSGPLNPAPSKKRLGSASARVSKTPSLEGADFRPKLRAAPAPDLGPAVVCRGFRGWSNLADWFGTIYRSTSRPTLGRFRVPNSADINRDWPKLDRLRAKLAQVWPNSGRLGEPQPKCAPAFADVGRNGQHLAKEAEKAWECHSEHRPGTPCRKDPISGRAGFRAR